MYGACTYRQWLTDALGWSSTDETLHVRHLSPGDRRLARHLSELRRSWLGPPADWNDHDDTSYYDDGADTDANPGPTPTFDPSVFAELLRIRVEQVRSFDVARRDLDELGVLYTAAQLCMDDPIVSTCRLDIALLALRRMDELIALHTRGPALAQQMVDDRHRAALPATTRTTCPELCAPTIASSRQAATYTSPPTERKSRVSPRTCPASHIGGTPAQPTTSLRLGTQSEATRCPAATDAQPEATRHSATPAIQPEATRCPAVAIADRLADTTAMSLHRHVDVLPATNLRFLPQTPAPEPNTPPRPEPLPAPGSHFTAVQDAVLEDWLSNVQMGARIRVGWRERPAPNGNRVDTTPVYWTGVVEHAWDASSRSIGVLWDKGLHRLTGTRRGRLPEANLPDPEIEYAMPVQLTTGQATISATELRKFLTDNLTNSQSPSWIAAAWTAKDGHETSRVGQILRESQRRSPTTWDVLWTHFHTSTGLARLPADEAGAIPAPNVTYATIEVIRDPTITTTNATTPAALSAHAQHVPTINNLQPPHAVDAEQQPATPHDPPLEDLSDTSTDEDTDEDNLAPLPNLWTADNIPTPDFHCGGTPTPDPAAMKGSALTTILLDDTRTPEMAKIGLTKATRQGHRRILRDLVCLPANLAHAPLVTALIEHINRHRRARRWQWSTTLTKMAATQGALRLLPLYSNSPSIDLRDNPMWLQAMRTARRETQCEIGHQPKALSVEDMKQAVAKEANHNIRAALITAWLTAARGGCTLQLRRENLDLQDNRLAVQFRKGKSVIARGPYTVHTTVPDWAAPMFTTWLAAKRKGLLFPKVTGEELKNALRRVHRSYEQRSIRRGSLQAMSLAGCSDEDLLLYSGHTNLKTLRRYLDWGMRSGDMQRRMPQHAETAL